MVLWWIKVISVTIYNSYLMTRAINANRRILVFQISFQSDLCLSILFQLTIDCIKSFTHGILTWLDIFYFSIQRILRIIINKINSLQAFKRFVQMHILDDFEIFKSHIYDKSLNLLDSCRAYQDHANSKVIQCIQCYQCIQCIATIHRNVYPSLFAFVKTFFSNP